MTQIDRVWRAGFVRALEGVEEGVGGLQVALAEVRAELEAYVYCETLKAASAAELQGKRPCWRNRPTSEQITDRGSDGQYVYLYWRNGEGPRPSAGRPQRKTYVGCRPDRVQLARRMVVNRSVHRAGLAAVTSAEAVLGRTVGGLRTMGSDLEKTIAQLEGVFDDRVGG